MAEPQTKFRKQLQTVDCISRVHTAVFYGRKIYFSSESLRASDHRVTHNAVEIRRITDIWGEETPWRIASKFCSITGTQDVITCIKFGDDWLRGFWLAGGSKFAVSHWLCWSSLQQCYATACTVIQSWHAVWRVPRRLPVISLFLLTWLVRVTWHTHRLKNKLFWWDGWAIYAQKYLESTRKTAHLTWPNRLFRHSISLDRNLRIPLFRLMNIKNIIFPIWLLAATRIFLAKPREGNCSSLINPPDRRPISWYLVWDQNLRTKFQHYRTW